MSRTAERRDVEICWNVDGTHQLIYAAAYDKGTEYTDEESSAAIRMVLGCPVVVADTPGRGDEEGWEVGGKKRGVDVEQFKLQRRFESLI